MNIACSHDLDEVFGTHRFSRTGAALCSTSCVIRTAQVTGPFDPLPSLVPSREVHGGSAAGTSQISQRPAELAQHRPAGLSVAGRCILPPMRRPGSRGLLPGGVSPKRPDIRRVVAPAAGPVGHAWARPLPTSGLPGAWRALHRGRRPIEISGASGSVNRLLRPDSVRHMSVTTATRRLTAAHHETRRHNIKKARETGKTQLTGHIRRWWQVLGSNQRRLSRRFYRESAPHESHGL